MHVKVEYNLSIWVNNLPHTCDESSQLHKSVESSCARIGRPVGTIFKITYLRIIK